MVGSLRVRSDRDCDADDAEEHVDEGPPCEVGEAAADGRYYRAGECDDPGELSVTLAPQPHRSRPTGVALTMPIEIVASANGSPMMRPTLKEEDGRPPLLYPFSILRKDGEPREPYEGITRSGGSREVYYLGFLGGRIERAARLRSVMPA